MQWEWIQTRVNDKEQKTTMTLKKKVEHKETNKKKLQEFSTENIHGY